MHVVIKVDENNDLRVVKAGDYDSCKAWLFDKCIPNSMYRNIKQVSTENGSAFEVEELECNTWVRYKYYLLFATNSQ